MNGEEMRELAEMHANLVFYILTFWPSVAIVAVTNFHMALGYDGAGYDYGEISGLLSEFPELPGEGKIGWEEL